MKEFQNPEVLVSVYVGKKILSDGSKLSIAETLSVKPTAIIRRDCGKYTGKYKYRAQFDGVPPMIDILGNPLITGQEYINRKLNPKWMPPKTGWSGNVWRPICQ